MSKKSGKSQIISIEISVSVFYTVLSTDEIAHEESSNRIINK